MEAGMIEKSESPWNFPIVVLVDKNDGRHLFCVDFRKLNADSRLLTVPLPLTDDILALLGKARYFSTIDLRLGYWQVALEEADRRLCLCVIWDYSSSESCHLGWLMLLASFNN